MAYCNLDNLKDKIEESELLRLCDDVGLGNLEHEDVAVIWEESIESAGGIIDAYCMSQCTVPVSPVPRVLQDTAVDIAIYALYSRRGDACPENRKERHTACIKFLEGVASGKNRLFSPASCNKVNISSSTRVCSRDNMEGF